MPIFIDSIEIKPKTIDLSLSGLGNFEGNALWINEVELVNAIELLRVESRCFQTQLCSCCGVEGCEPGPRAHGMPLDLGVNPLQSIGPSNGRIRIPAGGENCRRDGAANIWLYTAGAVGIQQRRGVRLR